MLDIQPPSAFGECLRGMRIGRGLSQQMLAERANISVAAVCALERGRRHAPYRETLQLLTNALELDRAGSERLASAATTSQQRRTSFRRRTERTTHGSAELPWYLSSFCGRRVELDTVAELLTARRLVTICGAAGVGKSRLMIAAASLQRETLGTLVRYFNAGGRCEGLQALGTTGGRQTRSIWTPMLHSEIVSEIGDTHALLVIDDCETEIESVASGVVALLRACPNLVILAASREALHIAGEHVYRIGSLTEDDAQSLFRDRATCSLAITKDDEAIVRSICLKLDGLPLAIELGAGMLRAMSLPDLAQRLDDPGVLLGRGLAARRDAAFETLRESLDRSFHGLSREEADSLRILSRLHGEFAFDDAATLLGLDRTSTLDILASLVERALLENERSRSRYRMLMTTRSFLTESHH